MNNQILRSAQSTPYIRSPTEATNEKENSNECLSSRSTNNRTDPTGVQFNTGCSSSSSDLSQLMEIYNDSGDNLDFGEWYKKQRLQNGKNGLFGSETLSVGLEGYLSDSCGNLITPQSCSTQSVCDQDSNNHHANTNTNNIHRSMDVLPTIKEGFYRLEKCVSVEFPPKIMIQPSKLCRSKEMQNILIEDDYE